jgi:apolipoprotein N-acyltransferase
MRTGAGSMMAPGLHVAAVAAINAAAWVGLEWLRGWLLGGFGWNGLGVALHANPAMIQVAEFTGVSGLSFLPVFVAVCLFGTGWRIQRRMAAGAKTTALNLDFVLAMLLAVSVFIFGTLRMAERDGATRTVQVVVVQRNIPQDTKWDPSLALEHTRGYLEAFSEAMRQRERDRLRHIEHTLAAGGEVVVNLAPPDIVLLPESALPFYLNDPIVAEFRDRLLAMAGAGAVLVTGINDAEPGEKPRFFNSIAVLDGQDTPSLVYRKINLVPFGEYLPLRWFPPMEWLAGAAVPGDFTPGTSAEPLTVATRNGPVGLIPMICFEDSLGRHARRFVRGDGPQILVNTTNDGWFPHPAAALQHAANAKFRCVELRRPMVRAANTGLSCAIDRRGMVLTSVRDARTGSAQTAGVMVVDLPVQERPSLTFFARFGDLFSWTCGAVALLVAFSGWIQAKKRRALSTARTSCSTSSSVL